MIIQHFDPKKADSIFEEGGSVSYKVYQYWKLQGSSRLVVKNDKTSRVEIADLPACWDIQELLASQLCYSGKTRLQVHCTDRTKRISDEGHQNEIASLATASTFFSVFNKVLQDSLQTIFTLDEVSLPRALPDFKVREGNISNVQSAYYLFRSLTFIENVWSWPAHLFIYPSSVGKPNERYRGSSAETANARTRT